MYKTRGRDSPTFRAVCHCYACDGLLGKARFAFAYSNVVFYR